MKGIRAILRSRGGGHTTVSVLKSSLSGMLTRLSSRHTLNRPLGYYDAMKRKELPWARQYSERRPPGGLK